MRKPTDGTAAANARATRRRFILGTCGVNQVGKHTAELSEMAQIVEGDPWV